MNPPHRAELDPETASLLLMGDTARRDENYEVAVACYERAIKRRAGHPGGLFNLAVCRMYLDRLEPALDALEMLEDKLATAKEPGAGWSDLRLSACYNAVLVHWYLAEKHKRDHAPELREAVRKCRSMALAIAEGLGDDALTTERRTFLDALAGATIALLAGLLVEAFAHGITPPVDAEADARARRLSSGDPAADGRLRDKLNPIGSSAPEQPEWVALLTSDTWHQLRTALALAKVARKLYGRNARTRYNLAVMQARVLRTPTPPGESAAEQALKDLEFALEHEPFRAKWAKRDNLLEPLKLAANDAYEQLFEPGAHPG